MSEMRPVQATSLACIKCDPPALSDSVTTPRNNGGSLIGEMLPTRAAAVTSPLTARLRHQRLDSQLVISASKDLDIAR